MAEYFYKGFKISYNVSEKKTSKNLYWAKAHILCKKGDGPSLTQKFCTEYPTKNGVKAEIKKIIEDYIDFEWKKYLEMQKKD